MATILRAYNDVNEKFDLDLFNEEAFLLDISAIESGDIGKVFGISSQTFALPATDNNTRYFGNLDNLGASPATSFIKTLPCQVLSDGEAIFQGVLYLDSVITDNKGDTIYNVNVVNETIDFKYQIQDLTFGNLDFTDYEHDLTYTNISSSWDLGLFGGDIVYPLAEYGAEKNDIDAVYVRNDSNKIHTFTYPQTPLKPIDFKPAIRLRTLVDKIFDSVNYSYTSSFLDSSYMDSVYVLATQDESRNSGAFVSPVSQSFKAYSQIPQNFTSSFNYHKVEFPSEVFDNGNVWNTTTSLFRAGTSGNNSFNTLLTFDVNNFQPFAERDIKITLYKNGVKLLGTERFYSFVATSSSTIVITDSWVNLPLSTGDSIELYLSFITNAPVENIDLITNPNNNYFQCYQAPMSYQGGNVDIGGLFNPQEKVLDFLNGVIQKFNLVVEPTKGDSSVISIETYNDWRDAGEVVDWTDKVDRSVKFEIKHPLANVPRDIVFSDVEDKDYFNTFSQDVRDTIFGSYTYLSEADLADGERKIGSYFAPTPMMYIEGTNNFIVPQIYASEGAGERLQRLAFKPRLLHYLGKKSNPQLDNGVWWMSDDVGTFYSQSQYPVFHHVNELPATSQSLDLHFGNLNHVEFHQQYVNAETPQDAFYTYWSEYVNELYDIDARLLTLNVVLKPNEIQGIKLNNQVFIDGAYYRINKISGANLTNESSVKVELLKLPLQRIKYPRRRISVGDFGGNDYSDLRVNTLFDSGRVEYVDYETGVVITDANLLSQASNRDGYRYFSGSNEVVWRKINQEAPTSNTSNGINYIDDRAYNVEVKGNGNIIGGYINDSIIVGSNNDLLVGAGNINVFGENILISGSVRNAFVINLTGSATITDTNDVIALNPVRPINGYDNDKVVIGNVLNQGSQYETYNVEEMYDGRILYLTGSGNEDRFHYHFTWSGSNGSSIVYINDSSNPRFDGQLQRYTTDGSLTASKIVNITPISGTIDGNPEEALTTPYDGLTAQIINGEWQVIQRKK